MKKKMMLLVFALVVSSAGLQVGSPFVSKSMADESLIAPTQILKVGRAHLRTAEEMQAAEAAMLADDKASETVAVPFRPTTSESDYKAAKAAVNAQAGSPGAEALVGTFAPPTVKGGTNFDGVDSVTAGNLRPPDTHGAIGKNHFVEVTNSHYDVYLRDGTNVKSISLASFFGYTKKTIFDPRVVYDMTLNRWIVSAEAFPESSTLQRQFLAISKTEDPEGPFFVYNFNVIFASGDFWDYPQLGMDQKAIIVTANLFGASSFKGANMFAVAKARLYKGKAFSIKLFKNLDATLAPPIVLDQNRKTFLVAAPNGSGVIRKYTLLKSSRGSRAKLKGPTTISVGAYAVPPDATQPGTTDKLDTIDNRFVNASTQNADFLWNIHTMNDAGRPGCRWYRIDTLADTAIVGNIIHASATSYDWNASIAANPGQDLFVTWSSTLEQTGTNAQVRFSGKELADVSIPAGSSLFTSATFYNPSADTTERWGDYSAVTLDPQINRNAWIINEKINTTAVWGSRIGRIGY